MRDVAVVINARLSSSRCPRKLLRPFAGTTLLDIAVEKLSRINVNEKYLAAGDDEIITRFVDHVCMDNDVGILRRQPDAIAAGEHDHTVSFRHYAETRARYILIMNPCLPMTRVETYDRAIKHFQEHPEIMTLTSVLPFQDIFFDKKGHVFTLPNVDHVSSTTADKIYKMAHVFHIIDRARFFTNGKFWEYKNLDPSMLEVSPQECFDIDDEREFEFCERLYKGFKL